MKQLNQKESFRMSDEQAKLKKIFKEPEVPVRPTVATILREYKLVESRDAIERRELEALTCGGLSPENYQYWNEKRKEEEERIQREAVEQRKLDAKLASERIQEKAKQKAEENQKRAQQFKEEEIKLKEEIAQQNLEELSNARERVDKVILEEFMTRLAVANKRKEKEQAAQLVKQETSQKKEEGLKAREEEDDRRRDKIRKIQAASLVSHKVREKYNPYALKEQGLSCEMSDSEAQFRIYLQKCEEAAQIMNTKQRVREEKEAQKKKIEAAKEKIASYRQVVKELSKYKR